MKSAVGMLFTALLISLSSFTWPNTNAPVATAVVEHWPPWEIAHDKKRKEVTEGLAIDIIQELCIRLNIEMQLKVRPWKRALQEIKVGKSDLIPMIAIDSDRAQYMHFTVPVYIDPLYLFYSTDRFLTFEWSQWVDLKPYKLQSVRGYSYGNDWDAAAKQYNLNIKESVSDLQSMKMLIANRTDLIPMYYAVGIDLLKELPGHEKILFSKKLIRETVFHFGISKKSFLASRIDEINSTLLKMKSDGTFKKILGEFYRE